MTTSGRGSCMAQRHGCPQYLLPAHHQASSLFCAAHVQELAARRNIVANPVKMLEIKAQVGRSVCSAAAACLQLLLLDQPAAVPW